MFLGHATVASRSALLLRTTVVFWLVAKAISWKLWLSDRVFPTIPVFDFLSVSETLHLALFAISLALLASVLRFSQNRILLVMALAAEVASCLLDQMRWQPWEYQYLLALAFFAVARPKPEHFLRLMALLLAATYLFSGLHKLDGSFLYAFWDKMVLRKLLHFSDNQIQNPIVHYAGLLLGFAEIAIGLGLLFARRKKRFAQAGILMHLLLLLVLGPFGLAYNAIVWPWNLAMALLLYVLFCKGSFSQDRIFFRKPYAVAAVLLLFVLPALNFAGRWDHYLSFNLYSGGVPRLELCVSDAGSYPELQPFLRHKRSFCGSETSLSPDQMALRELKVPLYPQWRTYQKLQNQWRRKFPKTAATFVVCRYPYRKSDAVELR